MSELFPLRFFQIISLTAITTIWAASSNAPNFSRATAAVENFALTSFTSPNLLANLSRETEEIQVLEQLAFERVNQYRAAMDLAPLKLAPVISEQARNHSQNMADSIVPFGHEGFNSRLAGIKQAIAYRSASENVAYNFGYDDPVGEAIAGWIDSPTHHRNMLGNYNSTGIGVAKNHQGEYYLTQIFVLEP
jgi:uncharacterized protein YkwD